MSVERFQKCDILIGRNDIEKYGFAKTISEDEIIRLAIRYGSPVIVKNGKKGKWYLKGQGISHEALRQKITSNLGEKREGVYTILLPEHLFSIGITIDDVVPEN
jgi:hypothetical protein